MKKNNLSVTKILDLIVQKLDENKAESILTLDVRKTTTITDYMVIATGTSTRHVSSLAHHLAEDLKSKNIRPLNDITQGEGHWCVVDLGNILIHLFTQEARSQYALEEMWGPVKPKRTRKVSQKSA